MLFPIEFQQGIAAQDEDEHAVGDQAEDAGEVPNECQPGIAAGDEDDI